MPRYDYQCGKCGQTVEEVYPMGEAPEAIELPTCPEADMDARCCHAVRVYGSFGGNFGTTPRFHK